MTLSSNKSAITKVQGVIIAVIIAVAAIAVATYYVTLPKPSPPPTSVENLGGRYNVTISSWEDHAEIAYVDETGEHSGYFEVKMRNGLDWIRVETPENATFLCWWDYGHMIKGYGERNVVVRNPSKEILESVANPSSVKELDPHEKILDVATAFTTSNLTKMVQIMEKYGATHIVVNSDDLVKAVWFYRTAGLNATDYLRFQDSSWRFTDAGKQTMISKLLENRDTGFTLIYEDQEIKVYKLD